MHGSDLTALPSLNDDGVDWSAAELSVDDAGHDLK
jgi:hypothetical protein